MEEMASDLLEEQKEGQVLSGGERSMRKLTEKAKGQILYRLEDHGVWNSKRD